MTASSRPSGRKRFPNWLRELVDTGEVSGVYWLDERKTIFRVPWTRVDSPEFDLAKDAMLFQRWAEFTGRYRVGERTDPSVWKTRFRCAIRKMSEIEEITVTNNLEDKGGSQPFRVFRFTKEVQNVSTRKVTKRAKKCNKDQRTKHQNSLSLGYTQYRHKKSRVTGQSMVRDVTCGRTKSVTQSWVNRDIVTNGVTLDGLHRCVTNEITAGGPKEKYWPIINGASMSHSNSYEITVSDLSLQQCIIGFTPSSPNTNRDCVTMDSQYYSNGLYHYDNDDLTSLLVNGCEMTRGGAEQSCLPKISLQEVNSVLQSCSYPHYLSQDERHPNPTYVTQAQVNGMHSLIGEDTGNNLPSELLKLGLSDDCQESKACGSDLNDLTEILGLHSSMAGCDL